MISNEILQVLSSDKMTENPVNRPKVGDMTSRPVYGFRIVPIAERLKTKGSIDACGSYHNNVENSYG
jgi:hypothetical protein